MGYLFKEGNYPCDFDRNDCPYNAVSSSDCQYNCGLGVYLEKEVEEEEY